ncbi:MAG: hypothetical protein LBO21_10320 [Synergistaceae bacterium]|jgi:hypothetical protein|nr:hypothetical protein [Synergistaceae bacterium]
MAFLDELKDQLLLDYQKEFYNERGMSGKYRLVLAGTELFEKYLKEPSDTGEIVRLFKTEKLAADVEFYEDEFQINEKVHNCVFRPLCAKFLAINIQRKCCPLNTALMRAIELRTGLAPEMLPVSQEDDVCKVGLGKMGNDNVVDAKGVF